MKGYIKHHGILGQKWGIRRYQNKDGSLTSAGKMRYRDDGTKLTLANMTDEEYDYAMKQMQREKAYKDMKKQSNNGISNFGSAELTKLGVTAAATAATITLTAALSDDGITDGKKLAKSILLAVGTTSIADIAGSFGGSVKTTNNSGSNSNGSNPLLSKSRDVSAKVGNPKGIFGAEGEKAYQQLFKNNPTDEQKGMIKSLRKMGYSADQIEQYIYHSAIKDRRFYGEYYG